MSQPIQCDNCGAVLLKDDEYCGECGAPRPTVVANAEAVDGPEVSPPPEIRSGDRAEPDTAWRVAAAVLGIVGVLVCLLGLASFVLFGLIEAEDMTPAENWLISAICCLLPIAGTGVALAVAGLVIWWTRLRTR